MENQHRLNVKTYEVYVGEQLNPITVQQYHVPDLPGLMLSPRSYQVGDNSETCSWYCSSLQLSRARNRKTHRPNFGTANGFAVGHIPS